MGLFSRKKPQQPLPPVPRFSVQQGAPLPTYESEFPRPEDHREQRMPEFPEFHAEPVTIPPPPQAPSFPRPQVDDKSQNPFTRPMDDRLPARQEPLVRPPEMPHPEALRVQQQPMMQPQQPMSPRQAPVEIPVREPAFTRRPVQYPDRVAVATQQASPWQRQEQQQPRPTMIPDRPLPPQMMPPQPVTRPSVNASLASQHPMSSPAQPRTMSVEDKPLFIKIGQYREAMAHLELLKQKIRDAEQALAKLEDLRAKEQTEIANAHAMLATVKDKLLAIDKQLFEV